MYIFALRSLILTKFKHIGNESWVQYVILYVMRHIKVKCYVSLFLIWMFANSINAQTNGNDHWFGTGYRIDWKNGEPTESFWDSSGHQAVGLDSNGNMIWYANRYGVFDRRGIKMPNSPNFYDTFGFGNESDFTTFTFASLPCIDSVHKHFLIGSPILGSKTGYLDSKHIHSDQGPGYYVINMKKNGGYGDVENSVMTRIFPDTQYYTGIAITQHANGKDYWLVTTGNTTYKNYTISGIKNYWSAHLSASGVVTRSIRYQEVSSGGSYLNFNNNGTMFYDENHGIGPSLFNFNNLNGNIDLFKIIYNKPITFGEGFHKTSALFTPNDSFIIIQAGQTFLIEFTGNSTLNDSGFLIIPVFQHPTLLNSKWISIDKYWFQSNVTSPNIDLGSWTLVDMQYGVDGKIYILHNKHDLLYNKIYNTISILHNPNNLANKPKLELLPFKNKYIRTLRHSYCFTYRLPSKYCYIEVDSQLCNTQFKNRSHPDFTKFLWYWGDGDSTVTSNRNPLKHFYKSPGKYRVKLLGKTISGQKAWTWQDVNIVQKPIAKFAVKDSVGCQFVKFKILDSTQSGNALNPNLHSWKYYFGNGKDTTIINPFNKSLDYTYIQSGDYQIKLIFNNGKCSDTFKLNKLVKISPATQAKITLDVQPNLCEGSASNLFNFYTSNIDSMFWTIENKQYKVPGPQGLINYTWNSAGTHKIIATVLGKSGCRTMDSTQIWIKKGLINKPSYLKLVTVDPSNKIQVHAWPNLAAAEYGFYSNGILKSWQISSVYNDANEATSINTYDLQLRDSCSKPSNKSNTINNIVLTGKINGDNFEFAYNPYVGFKVKNYEIQFLETNKTYSTKVSNSSLSQSIDANPFPNPVSCFRVAAICDTCTLISYSNTVCIEKDGKMYLPTSFSPNGDGINETWQPVLDGLKIDKITIYNRWGQKVFENGINTIAWDGSYKGLKCDKGVYVVLVHASNRNKKLEYRETITLLR